MKQIIRTSLSVILLLVLPACSLFNAPTVNGTTPVVQLSVVTQNGATTFNAAGDVINYNYIVKNAGSSPLAGPVIVSDSPRVVTCPEVNTVGNGDIYLDFNEAITCTASYTITASDVTTGSVINVATANVGGLTSNPTGVTLTLGTGNAQPASALTLTKAASAQSYNQVGQLITYNYTLTNVGTAALGPAQFMITDNKLTAPLACGLPDATIAPSQSLTCSAQYSITQADMAAGNVTNSATASGAGLTSAPATTTITNFTITQTASAVQTAPIPPSSNLSPGSTIQHQVAVGEWLFQIARCYGASIQDVLSANTQIADPDFILPSMLVTVPRIGSVGTIYGPPCVTFETVQSGDTWASIAQRHNADIVVLQRANPGAVLTAGTIVKVPRNSAGAVSSTAVPSLSATPISTTTPAMRITFDPPGSTTAARVGVINPNQTLQYVISANQDQVLTVKLTAPANEVAIGVTGPTGLVLKPLDASPIWTTTVTTGGDHTITLSTLTGGSSKSYTLEVSLTGPVTATVASTPVTPAP